MMRRYTYNNIIKVARLLSLVVLMAFGAGLKGWGQTPRHTTEEILYVVPGQNKTVRLQESGAASNLDGYVRWYTILNEGEGTVGLSKTNGNNNYSLKNHPSGGYYWSNTSNTDTDDNINTIICNFTTEQIAAGITLVCDASSVKADGTTPRVISIRRKYFVRNATEISSSLSTKQTNFNSLNIAVDRNSIKALLDVADKSNYVLYQYEIHTPIETGTTYRLPDKLSNYFIGTNQATRSRWSYFDENGTKLEGSNLEIKTTNYSDHIFPYTDLNKQYKYYILIEVATDTDVWYPVSLLSVILEPYSKPLIETELRSLYQQQPQNYEDRLVEELVEEGKYIRIVNLPFEEKGDTISPPLEYLEKYLSSNYRKTPSAEESYYAFSEPEYYQYRVDNRLSVGRGEYGLYRTLNYPGISTSSVSVDGGKYDDYFAGDGNYKVRVTDRLWEKTNGDQSGYFMYIDATDDPGVITKISLKDQTLCANTSLIVSAWVCELAHYNRRQNVSNADVGFTFKRKNNQTGDETILAKYYTGTFDNNPAGPINTLGATTAYWQQVSFKFSIPEQLGENEEYLLEISNNSKSSNGADYGIDNIQVFRSLPNIEVVRLDACEADSLTVSSDYETLLRNMGWTEGEPVVTKGHIYNGAVLDENLIKYRLGLNGADPGNPTTATENSYVGNTYFSFVEGFQNDNGMTLNDVTGDPSKEPNPIILPDDKNGVDNYRWVRINKSLQIPSHTATYAFRAIVTTQSPNSTPNYTYPKSREEALKYERVFNLRAVKDFNYLLNNWDAVYGNIPKPDWLSTADVQSITVSDELQKSQYYTITNIAGISDLPNMLPNEVEAYDKAITELYTHLLIPRIRVPWYVDGTMYLYTVDVRNTDLKHNGESVLNADGTTSTATGKYHVVLQGANAVESWDPETAATATFNLLDPCLLISPFTLYGSIQITVEAETDFSARACAGTQRKISAQLLSKDDGEPLTGVDYSFDWFLGGGYEEYWKISVDGYDLKSMLALVRNDESFSGEITYANVSSWNPADGTKQAIRKKLLELLNPEDAKLVTDKKVFSWLLSADSLVAMPFVTQGAANTSYCTEITAAPVPLYSTDVPELHPGFTLNGITYPFKGEVSLRLGHPNMGSTTTGDKIVLNVPLRDKIVMAGNAAYLGLAKSSVGDSIMLNDIEAQYPGIGLAISMKISKNETSGIVSIRLLEKAKKYLQEGQRYELLIPFVQYDKLDNPLASECDGLISLPVKIVPEYLTWKGESADNWYDESQWKQSTKKELYFNGWDGTGADTDANGSDDVAKAFSPLYFTKITIPEGQELALESPDISPITVGRKTYDVLNDWAADDSSDSIRYEMAVANADGEIVPYYINKVEQIYFKPEATLMNQHYLGYQKAWVEFESIPETPYWMSSPLKSVYAGNMYAPSSNGRQETEAFKDITYSGKNENGTTNSRWNPAFYQKAWDKAIRYAASDANEDGVPDDTEIANVNAVKSNWSIEYNDVTVPYSLGKGFYSKVEKEGEGNVLVRLPKADTEYKYETKTRALTNTEKLSDDYGRLADGSEISINLSKEDTETTQEEVDGDGTHFLVGNPYMSYLKMTGEGGFLTANSDVLANKFWTLDRANGSIVVGTPDVIDWDKAAGAHITDGQDLFVAPMTAFFVELNKDATTKTIKFTTAMMAVKPTTTDNVYTKSYSASNPILTLTAERGETRSVARLLTSDKGHDAYEASEDAVILLDSELDAPMVYTVAGDVAAQFNTMQSIKNVPLGVYADKGEEVELTIRGISQFAEKLYLYDAVTKQSTPLDDDSYTFRVTGPSHGRFTLTSQNRISAESDICVYSPTPGQLLVMSAPEEPLQRVQVYDMSGRMVTSRDNIGNTTSQLTVPSGIYVVYAENETGNVRVKVRVR